MTRLKTRKISINMAKPNMILAEDVVSKKGVIIISKNTMISDLNYSRLQANGIKFITIFEKEFENTYLYENSQKNVKNKKDFCDFKNLYNKKIEKIENQFISIGNGFGVEFDGIYNSITDIIKSVKCKSDIFNYLYLLQKKDSRIYEHCLNVSLIANIFALWLGYDDEKVKNITLSGILHDIGKTKIKDSIIKKSTSLTKEEYSSIKEHSYIGYKIVKDFPIHEDVKLAVLMHHEKIDGSGYPFGLKGREICQTAKIIAICDIYEAMTTDNHYRKKHCPFEVIRSLEQEYYELLDTRLLLAFLQNIAYTYLGSEVRLSDNTIAKIVFINQNCFSKPMVRVEDEFIDLFEQNLSISEVL